MSWLIAVQVHLRIFLSFSRVWWLKRAHILQTRIPSLAIAVFLDDVSGLGKENPMEIGH